MSVKFEQSPVAIFRNGDSAEVEVVDGALVEVVDGALVEVVDGAAFDPVSAHSHTESGSQLRTTRLAFSALQLVAYIQ